MRKVSQNGLYAGTSRIVVWRAHTPLECMGEWYKTPMFSDQCRPQDAWYLTNIRLVRDRTDGGA
jgi:hypothetical protein